MCVCVYVCMCVCVSVSQSVSQSVSHDMQLHFHQIVFRLHHFLSRYIINVTKRPRYPWRSGKARVAIGKRAAAAQARLQDPDITIKGIRGPPTLTNLPYFDETTSHISDTLHVICHGIVRDMLKPLLSTRGLNCSLRPKDVLDFTYQEDLRSSLKYPTEINHRPPSFSEFNLKWKGFDFFNFLLHEIVLLLSDEEIISDERIYPIFVHLSNAVYLLHHGNFNDAKRRLAQEELNLFVDEFLLTYTEEYATSKFHVLQHFPMLAKIHGPAYLWDAFIGKYTFMNISHHVFIFHHSF